ncbi:FecR family protein [Chitinophaga sp. XS-30]|uniref:FecR family protein n=1 Tax=Chitinophaga sp. XS-30 TaxID=2604421 RepID=UPI0011DDBD08|nr:FecR family protein [Chitinophaga sp. XS-30]QEH39533.1 FecR family protein [Chitinophaga sp. XS-30]
MQDDLRQLLEKYLAEELSAGEFERLWQALQEPANKKAWQRFMQDVWNNPQYQSLADDTAKRRVLENVRPLLHTMPADAADRKTLLKEMPVSGEGEAAPRRRRYLWWAAAACLVFAATALFWLKGRQSTPETLALRTVPVQQEVLPGGNKAILTLGDGSSITLDSAANGLLSQQGNVRVMKLANGQLAYDAGNGKALEVMYNTVRTPRGGAYRIVLPDGTAVWLNAASSITYPTAFTGKERKVKVSGEVYFEVAALKEANTRVPFIVDIISASGEQKGAVEVLGTHFNINAYDDEAAVKTTLLEGAVKIRKAGEAAVTLSPGQQAIFNTPVKITDDVDISQVIAWKDGYFKFTQADVSAMMRQAERWYDIKVEYPNGVPRDLFSGTLPRNVNLSQFLEILMYSDVNVRIDQRVVTINP